MASIADMPVGSLVEKCRVGMLVGSLEGCFVGTVGRLGEGRPRAADRRCRNLESILPQDRNTEAGT